MIYYISYIIYYTLYIVYYIPIRIGERRLGRGGTRDRKARNSPSLPASLDRGASSDQSRPSHSTKASRATKVDRKGRPSGSKTRLSTILNRFLVHWDPDLHGFQHQQATAKQLQQSTSQKQNHKTAQQQSIPPFMHIICLGLALLVPGWLKGWWGRAKRLELLK